MAEWQTYLQAHEQDDVARLLDLLRIPSISALAEHAGDVRRAASWTAAQLQAAGIEDVQVMETGGHPVVYGAWLHAVGKPTVLIYGHFDVQPVDPLALWTNPPFEPVVAGGRVYARGASDMKGSLVAVIAAVEALLETGSALPVNVKFFFEGQEEIGSPQLPAFVAAHRDLLSCNVVINADGDQWSETQDNLLVGLRGMAGIQIDVHGAITDLHSGVYGGAVPNPLQVLAELLASMHGPAGKVAVEGFYDGVVAPTAEQRARLAALPFSEEQYKARLGLEELPGEGGYTALERTTIRPTLEVNGMWGGFTGEGVKTVVPAKAHAKITCRLGAP